MWNIGWGLTNKCNLNCEFCYSKPTRDNSSDITDISVIKKFINENFHLVNSINYGTGENTLCDNWIEIVKYIKDKYPNIIQGLTTNGYLGELCEQNSAAEKIVIECLEEVDISLDFGDKDCHNKFRGNHLVYEWITKTLEFCKKHKKRTTIVFIGTNETLAIENIKSLFELAEKYDAVVRLNLFRPTSGINEGSEKFVPDFNAVKNALEYIDDNYKVISLSDPLFSSIFTHGEEINEDPSGLSSIRILPDGSITPSTYLISDEFKGLNIQDENVFEKLTNNEFQTLIDRTVPKECKGCQYEHKCQGGVLDRRYLWYKDFNKKDPYCPFDKCNEITINKLSITPKPGFYSVHDGYLPTMFFSN